MRIEKFYILYTLATVFALASVAVFLGGGIGMFIFFGGLILGFIILLVALMVLIQMRRAKRLFVSVPSINIKILFSVFFLAICTSFYDCFYEIQDHILVSSQSFITSKLSFCSTAPLLLPEVLVGGIAILNFFLWCFLGILAVALMVKTFRSAARE